VRNVKLVIYFKKVTLKNAAPSSALLVSILTWLLANVLIVQKDVKSAQILRAVMNVNPGIWCLSLIISYKVQVNLNVMKLFVSLTNTLIMRQMIAKIV